MTNGFKSSILHKSQQKCVHIPPYKEPDQYHLNGMDLDLIITKSRYISFQDTLPTFTSQTPNTPNNNDLNEDGSFMLQLSTNLSHATYLVEPIWKCYGKQFQPSPFDIECMLNYYNTNGSWTKSNYFIKRFLLTQTKEVILTPKSWKFIAEISLKAKNHNDCLTLLDDVISHYKYISKVIAWKEIVKVLLIKRAFHRIVDYSSNIITHVLENTDVALLGMLVHSFKISLKKNPKKISEDQINNVLYCIHNLYAHDTQKRNQLCASIKSGKFGKESDPNWYIMDSVSASKKFDDFSSISMDFADDNEQRECELIAFKLNCFEIEQSQHQQQKFEQNASILSVCEWMFYASAPQNFLYLVQSSVKYLLRQHVDSSIIWQFCLLSLLKCQYKFGECMKRFFEIVDGLRVSNVYAEFIRSLGVKYGRMDAVECRGMKYDIVQFMRSRDIMHWSFGNLQKWLNDLMNENGGGNRQFVEHLFSLMVMGMLYNDSLRVRPQLRGLLRFGSYHRLRMNEEVIFENEVLREWLLSAIRDPHHGLHPFEFYMDQFVKYNERILKAQQEDGEQIEQVTEYTENEMMIEHIQGTDTIATAITENKTMNHFVDDDVDKEYEFLKTLMPDTDILNPTLS